MVWILRYYQYKHVMGLFYENAEGNGKKVYMALYCDDIHTQRLHSVEYVIQAFFVMCVLCFYLVVFFIHFTHRFST